MEPNDAPEHPVAALLVDLGHIVLHSILDRALRQPQEDLDVVHDLGRSDSDGHLERHRVSFILSTGAVRTICAMLSLCVTMLSRLRRSMRLYVASRDRLGTVRTMRYLYIYRALLCVRKIIP